MDGWMDGWYNHLQRNRVEEKEASCARRENPHLREQPWDGAPLFFLYFKLPKVPVVFRAGLHCGLCSYSLFSRDLGIFVADAICSEDFHSLQG
jgi:hypothetical protein